MPEPAATPERAWVLDGAGVRALLPHREPMLLLDGVVAHEPGVSLTAVRRIDPADPVLAGHFPGHPIYPGALVLEMLAQTAVALLRLDPARRDRLWLFGGVDKARFLRPVAPGDELELEATLVRATATVAVAKVRARVGGKPVARGEVIAGSVPRPEGLGA